MSARQSLALLGILGILSIGAFVILAWRLGACLSMDQFCLLRSAVDACRLLLLLGIRTSLTGVGYLFLGGALLLPLTAVAASMHCWRQTLVFARRIRARQVFPLPREVAIAARELSLDEQVDVVEAPEPFAFAYGLVRPRVCLSTGLLERLDRTELWAVLGHERAHRDRRDPLIGLVGHALATLLCWLPVARDLADHLQLASEVEADAVVAQTPSGRIALAGALGKILTETPVTPRRSDYAISGLSVAERRIDELIAGTFCPRLTVSWLSTTVSTILMLVLFCLLVL